MYGITIQMINLMVILIKHPVDQRQALSEYLKFNKFSWFSDPCWEAIPEAGATTDVIGEIPQAWLF